MGEPIDSNGLRSFYFSRKSVNREYNIIGCTSLVGYILQGLHKSFLPTSVSPVDHSRSILECIQTVTDVIFINSTKNIKNSPDGLFLEQKLSTYS